MSATDYQASGSGIESSTGTVQDQPGNWAEARRDPDGAPLVVFDGGRVPWRAVALVAGVALAVRVVLFVVSSRPLFMTDTGEYLEVAHTFYLPADRPVGVSMFFRIVLGGVWHDLRAIVIVHALLGVASAVLAMIAALMLGLRARFATAVGLAVALSPTMLVYERLVLAETLVVVLTLAALVLFLSALRSGRFGRAIAAGVVVGLIATVRSNNAVIIVGFALLVLSGAWTLRARTRVGLVVALWFGFALPALGYAAMNYADTRARLSEGTFSLTNFDGISLFARVAHLTDCSEPDSPPAIRAEVCAEGEDYLESGVGPIIWDPGPVNSAMGSAELGEKNAELRELALEAIAEHPWTVLREGLATAWDDLVGQDYDYQYRAADAGYAGAIVERFFGSAEAQAGDRRFSDAVQDVYGVWIRLRPLVWLGLLGSIVLGFIVKGRPTAVALLGLGAFVLPIGLVALAGAPGPRYVVPYEFVGFVGTAWLAQWLVESNRRRDSLGEADLPAGVALEPIDGVPSAPRDGVP